MPNALLSVYDKRGLIDFAQALHSTGWQLIASGGTANHLREHQIPVTEVADYTRSPEVLAGRVKTLHPAIHAGILARDTQMDRDQLENMNWQAIDLVVVNLYPFESTIAEPQTTLDEAIENIDIGGVALIRAAAKNHQRVITVIDPEDYDQLIDGLKQGDVSEVTRLKLAAKGFAQTAQYDAAISAYLNDQLTGETSSGNKSKKNLELHLISQLRYGENPHQTAELYGYEPDAGPLGGQLLSGKALSYNNLLDLDAAWRAVLSFERSTKSDGSQRFFRLLTSNSIVNLRCL